MKIKLETLEFFADILLGFGYERGWGAQWRQRKRSILCGVFWHGKPTVVKPSSIMIIIYEIIIVAHYPGHFRDGNVVSIPPVIGVIVFSCIHKKHLRIVFHSNFQTGYDWVGLGQFKQPHKPERKRRRKFNAYVISLRNYKCKGGGEHMIGTLKISVWYISAFHCHFLKI